MGQLEIDNRVVDHFFQILFRIKPRPSYGKMSLRSDYYSRLGDLTDDLNRMIRTNPEYSQIDWDKLINPRKVDLVSASVIARSANVPESIIHEIDLAWEEAQGILPRNYELYVRNNIVGSMCAQPVLRHLFSRNTPGFNCFISSFLYPSFSVLGDDQSYKDFLRYLSLINRASDELRSIKVSFIDRNPSFIKMTSLLGNLSNKDKAEKFFWKVDQLQVNDPGCEGLGLLLANEFSSRLKIPSGYGRDRIESRLLEMLDGDIKATKMVGVINSNYNEDRIQSAFKNIGINNEAIDVILSDISDEMVETAQKSWIREWLS